MTDFGLQVRMLVVGVVLFAFYLLAATIVAAWLGIGIVPVFVLGLVLLPLFQYKLGTWLATRGAQEMPEDGRYREVHQMTEMLARDMGLPKPKLMVMDMGVPNAFATGRKGKGVVCVSPQLLQLLERDELEGVIAHELAHLNNRDTITMIVGQSVGMMVSYAVYLFVRQESNFLVAYAASMVAQTLTLIFVMAISRYREYVADADARRAIGQGDPLARALEKISAGSQGRESRLDDNVSALCILNSDRSLLQQVFATHPPTEKRIARLRR